MTDRRNPDESLQARARAYRSWANTADPSARTAPARAKFEQRFEREVDPNGTLIPEVRARRAAYARQAYFLELAHKSARARARRTHTRRDDTSLAAELRAAAEELSGEVSP